MNRDEKQERRRVRFKKAMWWILTILSAGTAVGAGVNHFRDSTVMEAPP